MDAWLKCDVGPGMFSTEAAILVMRTDGIRHAYWVPADQCDPQPKRREQLMVRGKVKGDLTYDKDGHPWMRLPVAEYTCIPVRKEDICE